MLIYYIAQSIPLKYTYMIINKLFVLDRNTWNQTTVCEIGNFWYHITVYKQMKRDKYEGEIMIIIKHLEMNDISHWIIHEMLICR